MSECIVCANVGMSGYPCPECGRLADDEGLSILLAFDTEEPEFSRGFEAGRLWEMLKNAPERLDGQPFHAENAEMVLRMLDASGHLGLTAEFTEDARWMVLRA